MNDLERLFAEKQTENGDATYNTTGNKLLDILFMTSYYEKHLDEVTIGNNAKEKLFAMFIRDPRYGLGRRDLGRELMLQAEISPEDVVLAGRFDDLLVNNIREDYLEFIVNECKKGNELAKKWMPRLTGKDAKKAKFICRHFNIKEKDYRKMIKCDTTERKLSEKRIDDIDFEHVPSLAMVKYYKRFMQEERFQEYISQVKQGSKKLNISTTTVYDIYRNRDNIDADLFFDKIEKIKINCIPVLDTSGSMFDTNDSIGKAMSIAHYLAKCSTYCNNQVVSFSSNPRLIKIVEKRASSIPWYKTFGTENKYSRELNSMYTGDCSNTDFGKVMYLLGKLESLPEYLVVLSDTEFDRGSAMSKNRVMELWKAKGYQTKIVWWNFNSRNTTVPELDEMGNIYISGYSPMLLKFLEVGFNGEQFLNRLLTEYQNTVFHL